MAAAEDASDGKHREIFELADRCQGAFKDILKAQQDGSVDEERVASLFRPQKGLKTLLTLRDLNDEYEQFRVWAKNLGVFATDRDSLDFRLTEASNVKEGIASLLNSLRSQLVTSLNNLRGDREEEQDDSSDDSDSDVSSSLDPNVPATTYTTATEIQARFESISETINKLMKLAEIIRASGLGSRALRAARYVHLEDGVNVVEEFEKFYLPKVLKHRYKLIPPLLDRFVKAIALRRRTFIYQSKHQERLAYGIDAPADPTTYRVPVHTFANLMAQEFDDDHIQIAPSPIPAQMNPRANLSEIRPSTKATTFQQMPLKRKVQSTIISNTTRSTINGTVVPPAPRVFNKATHVECPYCCLMIPTNKLQSKHWKQHVIMDLRPFVCLEPKCPYPDSAFETKNDWIEHQKWEHAIEWWCEGEGYQHIPQKFSSSEDYRLHLLESHGSHCSDADVERQVKIVGRPSLTPFPCCPLCDFQPESSVTADVNSMEDRVSQTVMLQRILQEHILDEMLNMFLIALPERNDLDISDAKSVTERVTGSLSTLNDLTDVSLRFEQDSQYQDMVTSAEQDHIDSPEYEPLDAEWSATQWQAIWSSTKLRQSIRQTYGGIETDEILQDFAFRANVPLIDMMGAEDDELSVMKKRAALLRTQGRYVEAMQAYRKTLNLHGTVLGWSNHETLSVMEDLASVLSDHGMFAKAEQMLARALNGYEMMSTADDMSILRTVTKLGAVYYEQDKHKEAEQVFLRALLGYEKVMGLDHQLTLNVYNSLGRVYRDQDRNDEAEEMFSRAFAGFEKALGLENESTLTALCGLGTIHFQQGNLEKALEEFGRALAGFTATLGFGHQSTLMVARKLEFLHHDQGRLAEAQRIRDKYKQDSTRPAYFSAVSNNSAAQTNSSNESYQGLVEYGTAVTKSLDKDYQASADLEFDQHDTIVPRQCLSVQSW